MNWKKVCFGLVLIGLPLVLLAQTIRWYNDALIPQKVTLDGNEVFSLQQTGPNAYRWVLASDLRNYMAGQVSSPVVHIYVDIINVTTNYITNAYITYLTVLSNSYFYNTQFVSYSIVTNLTVIESLVVESNVTIRQNLNVKQLNVTSNIYYLTATATNSPWAGPTNTLNFTYGAVQSYATWVPISVTNVTGQTNNWQNSTILCITNTSGSNITCTVTASGWKTGRGDTMTCTNGGVIQFWFQNIGDMKTLATKEYP